MTTAIIVEDEYLAREELTYLINKHSKIEIKADFNDGLEAFKYLQSAQVDVVFLDINIPSIDGVMLAKNLHQMPSPPHIIFTTAYKEHAADAFEIEALDYLLKPLNEQRMLRALEKLEAIVNPQPIAQPTSSNAKSHPADGQNHLPLQDGSKICIIDKQDIVYAWANEKITQVYTTQGQELVAQYPISELISRLPEAQFYRCHRSYCINLQQIKQIKPSVNSTYLLTLAHAAKEVPVSRGNVKEFRILMGL
ncbi:MULTISPECIES: LytR/AlgR family response regulator transcription factor [Vibrio]|uniref:Response regulator n=1 Tax=Vibrio algicola TaxID=2662262 RepID=A0A5Q0THG5_9VIBR|nr:MULTISPECIES: LytTR family DNA-binding domain-containing protein [Vibrio]MBD1577341.1 response regulator transcription factor [Vibrio sp. S11_S32]